MKEVTIDYTKAYMKDLRKFTPQEKNKIDQKINRMVDLYLTHPEHFYQNIIKLNRRIPGADAMESSLYVYKLDRKIRLIFSIDEDPIFDQLLITLFRMVRPDNLEKAFRSIASSLYQSSKFYADEVGNDG